MDWHFFVDVALVVGAFAGGLGPILLERRYRRRDRAEEKIESDLDDHESRISHIEGFLNI